MTLPLLGFTQLALQKTHNKCQIAPDERRHPCAFNTFIGCLISTDILVFITALAVGILGILSYFALPAIVSYSLIGLSTGIALLWLTLILTAILNKRN